MTAPSKHPLISIYLPAAVAARVQDVSAAQRRSVAESCRMAICRQIQLRKRPLGPSIRARAGQRSEANTKPARDVVVRARLPELLIDAAHCNSRRWGMTSSEWIARSLEDALDWGAAHEAQREARGPHGRLVDAA